MTGDKSHKELKNELASLKAEIERYQKKDLERMQLKQAFESLPVAIKIADPFGKHLYHNQAFSNMFSLDRPTEQTPSFKQLYDEPDIADQIYDTIISGKNWTGEVKMKNSKGEIFYADLNASPISNPDGKVVSLASIIKDSSEKKRLEKQKELHFQYLQTLQSLTLGMMRRLDLSNLLNVIIAKACSLTQISNGFVFLYDSEKEHLVLKAGWGHYKTHMGFTLLPGEGIVGQVFKIKEPIILSQIGTWENRSDFEMIEQITGIIAVPLASGSRLHGVIGLGDNNSNINGKLIKILEDFSAFATIAIDNSQLHENLKTEFNKRIETEKISRKKERRAKEKMKKQNIELKKAYIDSIHRLVMASEFKDEDTGDHIVRIGEYSKVMAQKLGWSKKDIETITYASPMHDVGKIGIPDKIMLKPGKLTDEEFEIIKTHTTIGGKLLSDSNSDILDMARDIALYHHEKYNGKGYPQGLSKDEIPLCARIVAIADTFDALTSKRPYKEPYPPEMVLDIIRKERGQQFDPDITDLFIEHFEEFLEIRQNIGTLNEIDLATFTISERDKFELACK